MKLHKYQAKALLAQYGFPVSKGKVAFGPSEARDIADEIGNKAVIKAHVYTNCYNYFSGEHSKLGS